MNRGRAGGLTTSWVSNPYYSVSHAFLNHDKLIGSLNPCYDGGLVWEALVLCFSHLMAGGVKT